MLQLILRDLRALRGAETFEAAVEVLIRRLAAEVEARTPGVECAGGSLQVRLGGSDRAVCVGPGVQVSSTLRRAVEAARGPALLVVDTARLFVHADRFGLARDLGPPDFASRSAHLSRGVLSMLGLPVMRGGQVVGVVTLEVTFGGLPSAMVAVVERLQDLLELGIEAVLAQPVRRPALDFHGLPAMSPPLSELLASLEPFTSVGDPLTLVGPPGLGQPAIAEWCHRRSPRHEFPFVVARFELGGPLYGQELFGWTKAPMAGVPPDHKGILGQVRQGTVFVAEAERLPLHLQAGLAEAIEVRAYRPHGVRRQRRHRARVILGLGAPPEALVRAGRLDPGLAALVSWASFTVPGLAGRGLEIPGWARGFLDALTAEGERPTLAAPAATLLRAREWPRNLEELREVMRRALALARSEAPDVGGLVIRARHVREALGWGASEGAALRQAMRRAAAAFVDAAELMPHLGLRHAEAFLGDVIAVAVERHGKREAMCVLGREAEVRADNHHRTVRRFARAVADLSVALEAVPPSED